MPWQQGKCICFSNWLLIKVFTMPYEYTYYGPHIIFLLIHTDTSIFRYSGQLNLRKPYFVKELDFHQKQVNDKARVKKEPKKTNKETVNSTPKSQTNKEPKESNNKPKTPVDSKESPSEKKEAKVEKERSAKKEERSSKSDKNHVPPEKNKSDQKNSTQSSPRRGDSSSRSVEPIEPERGIYRLL